MEKLINQISTLDNEIAKKLDKIRELEATKAALENEKQLKLKQLQTVSNII